MWTRQDWIQTSRAQGGLPQNVSATGHLGGAPWVPCYKTRVHLVCNEVSVQCCFVSQGAIFYKKRVRAIFESTCYHRYTEWWIYQFCPDKWVRYGNARRNGSKPKA